MNQCIIYKNDEGRVSVIIPAPEAVVLLGIDAIAQKDVPTGKPYKIVDASEIPTDRIARDLWDVDDADLTDGVGSDYGAGSANAVVGWDEDGNPITVKVAQ